METLAACLCDPLRNSNIDAFLTSETNYIQDRQIKYKCLPRIAFSNSEIFKVVFLECRGSCLLYVAWRDEFCSGVLIWPSQKTNSLDKSGTVLPRLLDENQMLHDASEWKECRKAAVCLVLLTVLRRQPHISYYVVSTSQLPELLSV